MAEGSGILSVHDVALRLDISDQQVRSLVRKGVLASTRIGKQWVIDESALQVYLQDHRVPKEPKDHERKNDTKHPITGLSFFSGAMGLDIGLEAAGISTVLACEVDKACRTTIHMNRPELALIGDISDYSAEDILRMAKVAKEDVDIIYGGPPCQAFSTAGKRQGFKDQRGNVFLKFIDIIGEIMPPYILIENVRGLLSAPLEHRPHSNRGETDPELALDELPGGALLHVLERLRSLGYAVSFNLYNSANFGAPQIRERVVILGHLGSDTMPYLSPTHSEKGEFSLPRWRTLSDALSQLKADEHHYVEFPESRLKYYRLLKEGQNWRNLPLELQKAAMGNSFYSGGGKTGFLRRLSFKKPSPTLVTHPAMPATDLAHPTEDRPLSVEEYKVIQEFPDDWEICGSLLDQYKQIGNAVPIKLGEAIGRTIVAHMNNTPLPQYPNFKYSRYSDCDEASWQALILQTLARQEAAVTK